MPVDAGGPRRRARRRRASSWPAATATSPTTCSRCRPAELAEPIVAGPPRPDGRGRLRRAARAGAHGRGRAAAAHAARADRGAAAARRPDGAIERVAAVHGGRAGVGRRRASRARRRRSARRRVAKASCPGRKVRRNFRAPSPVGPGGAPRPGAALPRRLIVLLTAALVLVPAASAHAGWFPARADRRPERRRHLGGQRRPRPRRHRRGRLPAATATASRTRSSRASSAAAGGRRSASTSTAGDGRPRSRSRPATATGSRSPGSPTATSTPRSTPGGDTPGGFAPAGRARRARARRSLDIDLGVNGAAYAIWQEGGNVVAARLQDATWTRVAAPLDIDPGARGRHRRRCARRSPSPPRATRSRPGASVHAGRLHARLGPPDHRPEPVGGPAGPRRCRRRQRRLARHRHRGRRLLRVGRLPPGRRRRLAHVRAAAASARSTRRRSHRRRASRRRSRRST